MHHCNENFEQWVTGSHGNLGLGFGFAGCVVSLCMLRLWLGSLIEGRVVLQQRVKQHNALVLEEPIEVGIAVR